MVSDDRVPTFESLKLVKTWGYSTSWQQAPINTRVSFLYGWAIILGFQKLMRLATVALTHIILFLRPTALIRSIFISGLRRLGDLVLVILLSGLIGLAAPVHNLFIEG